MNRGIAYTVIFTIIAAFVFVFILAAGNELTKETVKRNEELLHRKTVLKAFNIPFSTDDDAFRLYDEKIKISLISGEQVFVFAHDGTEDYAVSFQGMGLWGIIYGVLAVNKDVTRIAGIEFSSHNETPGLGGRIDEDAYKNQFKGERIGAAGKINGTRNNAYDSDHENNAIDGITGATRTSESVIAIVNREIGRLKKLADNLLQGDHYESE
jgi:Na+-transporting NADH:ubiquinone oxidoreductase subunit C